MDRASRNRNIVVGLVVGAVAIALGVLGVTMSALRQTTATPSPSGAAAGTATSSPLATASIEPSPSLPSVAPTIRGVIRVDQLGYLPEEPKVAYLLASASADGAPFSVLDATGSAVATGTVGVDDGDWNEAYPAVHRLDLSAIHEPGTYRVAVGGAVQATSPFFRVASSAELFRSRVGDAVAFFQAQRDGPDVIAGDLHRQPSHLNDGALDVHAWPTYEDPDSDAIVAKELKRIDVPVDLVGGWFDAGDFIKFTHTTAYSVGLMYTAMRELGADAPATLRDEARFGQDWLERAWDADRGILYIQVGIGSGNTDGTFTGDHDLWRLPEADDALADEADRYLSHRPAFRAGDPGTPLPPNLAGRMAAALALAAQVDATVDPARAREELQAAAVIVAKAKTANVKEADVVTALPHAFYPESSWRDDMEWAGAELALAGQALDDGRAADWLRGAATWAKAYLAEEAGDDTFNLYDTSALAHTDLVRAMRAAPGTSGLAVGEDALIADLKSQLKIGAKRSHDDPFGAGAIYDDFDAAPHTFGLISTAWLYGALTGDTTYASVATPQRDWALGANPWGVSLMIGVGSVFAQCPQHVVANLAGSVDGQPPILRGAVVNGPNKADLFTDGLGEFFEEGKTCPVDGVDRYAAFNARGSQFVDDVRSWQTVEPAIDFTAAALLAFALLQ